MAISPIIGIIVLIVALALFIGIYFLLSEWRKSRDHERQKEKEEREQQNRVIEAIEDEY